LYPPYLVPLIANIKIAIVNAAPIAASAIATSGACSKKNSKERSKLATDRAIIEDNNFLYITAKKAEIIIITKVDIWIIS